MIKTACELVPGDCVDLGQGSKLVVASEDTGVAISILLEGGQVELLRYDCNVFVFYNLGEQRELRRKQLVA